MKNDSLSSQLEKSIEHNPWYWALGGAAALGLGYLLLKSGAGASHGTGPFKVGFILAGSRFTAKKTFSSFDDALATANAMKEKGSEAWVEDQNGKRLS